MLALSRYSWISGTLELTSKVRYGLTSRGVPIFRFVPYDKRFPPLAVGCSQRNLFYNVHAVVEPFSSLPKNSLELQKASLVQNLGQPDHTTEAQVLLNTYAFDSRKELRTFPPYSYTPPDFTPNRPTPTGTTFHIDPPGCRDVDDSLTFHFNGSYWQIAINIADVAEAIPQESPLDLHAKQLATSFYTPNGTAVQPMLPRDLSEEKLSLLPGSSKLTVSLCFDFYPGAAKAADKLTNLRWELTQTTTTTSYTYDQADLSDAAEIKALKAVAEHLGAPPNTTSHEWIQALMIFYNKKAGELLEKHPGAILRRHSEAKSERVAAILGLAGVPQSLAFEAAEYCLTSDTNTFHFGLAAEKYAYATSPLRRYADLVNQRCIKSILLDTPTTPLTEQEVVVELNRREKQAKAFSRDYFFMTRLAHSNSEKIYGTVISSTGLKTRVWVSHWNRTITVKHLESKTLKPGSVVAIEWYDAKEKPRWKERIVFRLEEKQTL